VDAQGNAAGQAGISSGEPLPVVVVGAGAFGRNHLRVWAELASSGAPVRLAAVVDAAVATRSSASAAYGIPGFASVEDLCAAIAAGQIKVALASIAVPTAYHRSAAEPLLAAGADVMIEKPLAASLDDADAILAAAAHHGRMVQTGHLERFNPAVTAVRPLLDRPMFFEAHRLSIFTPRSLDVDVVLDLMIHDLDIVRSMVAAPVREIRAVGLPVLSGKVDIANVRLEFENGCVANFTASRVSTERVRKLRFFQPQQYISLDFARQDVLLIDVKDAAAGLAAMGAAALPPQHLSRDRQQAPQAQAAATASAGAPTTAIHPSAGLGLRQIAVDAGEPLRLELESFLYAVRTRTTPLVSGEDGRAALDLALQINATIAEHSQRTAL
jgi:predicted dehydrogenase